MERSRTPVVCTALLTALFCLPALGAVTNMLTGLPAPVGIAADRTTNTIYFVEFNGGTLKKVTGSTSCAAPACTATTIASGFVHPEDVALDVAGNAAYVTTRDDPGTTGSLWRVDLGTGTRTLITFNLGAPHQISLDVATNSAYVVGFDSGRLWKVDLTTGSKVTLAKLLDHPVGLAVTANRAYAYVTEQGSTSAVSKIDLATGARVAPAPATGVTSPFFLSWADPGETTLYLVERSPNNDVLRIDLPTTARSAVITALPSNASGIALDWLGGFAYITSNSTIVRAELGTLTLSNPVFLGVGFVPVSDIHDGYATTSTPRISAKDAPFGGTLDIFANLNRFKKAYSATHYRVLLDGNPLSNTWTSERFNTITGRFESVGVGPAAPLPPSSANTLYEIPPEYPTVPERWYPPYLLMRWASGANGLHTFAIELYAKKTGGTFDAVPFSTDDQGANSLTVLIDNDPPQVDLLQVYQFTGGSLHPIATCSIVNSGDPKFEVGIKAYDPDGHLLNYSAWANWGHSRSGTVISTENYEPAHVVPSRLWYGVTNFVAPTPAWTATCNCAHIFYVGAWKRTINGYGLISYGQAHQAITINDVASPTNCP